MRTHLLIVLFILKGIDLSAFGYLPVAGAESSGMGGIGLLTQNAFSSANHPAIMPWQKTPSIGFSIINRYCVSDLNQVYLTAIIPHHSFGYGFKLYNFGNSDYKENSIGLSAAHAFVPNFSLGLGINYHSLNIVNYGHHSQLTAEISIAAKVNEHLSIAFRMVNPGRPKLNEYMDERYATTYQFGLGYKINKQVNTLVQIEKTNAFKPDIRFGINYMPKENFNLRMGFASLQPQFTFGFGYKHKKYTFEYASIIHQALGISNNISLTLEIGK